MNGQPRPIPTLALLLLLWPFGTDGEENPKGELPPPPAPMSLSQYPTQIDEYRQRVEKYMERKKRVCRGEFSKVILSDNPPPRDTKLSPEEKKLCLEQLKKERISFINNMYDLRRRYLIDLHNNRLKQLEEGKNALLKSLKRSGRKHPMKKI